MSISPASVSVSNTLRLTPGAVRVKLSSQPNATALFESEFMGQNPHVTSNATSVQIDFGRFNPIDWRRKSTTLILNATNPWDILVDGGASRLTADLSSLTLHSLIIQGGATHLSIALSRPQGEVQIFIGGGVRNLSILRPDGIPAQLTIKGGTSKLQFDGKNYRATGEQLRTHSNAYDLAADRYDIVIAGGARHVVLATTGFDDSSTRSDK